MRTDLTRTQHDDASHDAYVYGSAEVVGLMCLQIFVNAGRSTPLSPDPTLVEGARRLGAAFQDVNFLRDRADDENRLGRLPRPPGRTPTGSPSSTASTPTWMPRGRSPTCPPTAGAVTTAHGLFAELSRRLRDDDETARVSVPTPVSNHRGSCPRRPPPKRSTA
jgi:hypothetical protein